MNMKIKAEHYKKFAAVPPRACALCLLKREGRPRAPRTGARGLRGGSGPTVGARARARARARAKYPDIKFF